MYIPSNPMNVTTQSPINPEAERIFSEHLAKVRVEANTMLRQHPLEGWSFDFDRSTVAFGRCHYNEKRITLSPTLTLLNPDHWRQTVLHEIAHALTPDHHHDHVWKSVARLIGHSGDRCYGSEVIRP